MNTYAIISVGGKQYRVHEGETLLVDRLKHGAGNTFQPTVLLIGGDGGTIVSPSATVTASVVADVKGDKIRIGKYRPKNGYKSTPDPRQPLGDQDRVDRRRQEGCREEERGRTRQDSREGSEGRSRRACRGPRQGDAVRLRGFDRRADQGAVGRLESADALEAALEYEQAHGKRKGAIAAIEHTLAEKESD